MSRLLAGGIWLVLVIMLTPANASAHVLISDVDNQVGAVLHVNPDDDPVAGEGASLLYIFEDPALTTQNYEFSLEIVSSNGSEKSVPIAAAANTVAADYVFPSQDLYELNLRARTKDTSFPDRYFTHSQRVSRGVLGAFVAKESYIWAEAGVIFGITGLFALIVLARGNSTELIRKSSW